ncbi:hypothetical protein M728_005596 (plasmid) [Ensifer sp. WSM1721]|uniref:hypothetical protein n=1 Tax=Ensifer sp. WSM1721 TaxID=1041159 RepID=UPI0004BA73F8|nr:hypothetical protein [Ensifer sp. WSM1721]
MAAIHILNISSFEGIDLSSPEFLGALLQLKASVAAYELSEMAMQAMRSEIRMRISA